MSDDAAKESGVPPELLTVSMRIPSKLEHIELTITKHDPLLFECIHQRFVMRCNKGCHDDPPPTTPGESMEVISTPRGGGKTTKLVNKLLDHPRAVIVVSTSQRRSQMRPVVEMVMRRRDMLDGRTQTLVIQLVDVVMERVITCDTIQKSQFALGQRLLRDRSHVFVDDLEDVLHYFLGSDVTLATTSFLPDLVGR